MTATREEEATWARMKHHALDFFARISRGRTPFSLTIALPHSYDQLISGQWDEVAQEDELARLAIESGRVLLSAEAGSGKTHLLARAGASAAASTENVIPIWIPLRDLPSAIRSTEPESFVQALIGLSRPSLKPVLTSSSEVPMLLLLADGLNEIPRELSQPALDALDELARRFPFISVIVSERLVRRQVPLDRWTLATVLPLSKDQVEGFWSTTQEDSRPSEAALELFRNPFFLDKATTFHLTDGSAAKMIESYFSKMAQVKAAGLNTLSEVCYASYSRERGMLIPLSDFKSRVEKPLFQALEDNDLIRTSDTFVWFAHHLFHDFLASRHLVQHRGTWGPGAFDVVTTGAASFDSLRLAVDQIHDPAVADEFVRLVYDWNYFGAAYSLVPGRVTREMQVELLAMLADKRWDPVAATVQAATDALRLNGSDTARKMLTASSRAELFRVVEEVPSSNPSFIRWRTIFTFEDGEYVGADIVESLASDDPIEAWTLANVLRRCRLTADGRKRLLAIARHDSPVTRWRVVHVLGLHPSPETAAVVESLVNDPDKWVRYGAVRALIEVAANTDDASLRTNIVAWLGEQLAAENLDAKMLQELARVLDVRPQPLNWPQAVAPLVQQLASTSRNSFQQDRWNTLMASISTGGGSSD
ncbi:NACHT domain-containing protein [Streptomyces panaciradicis]|uniref:NACHT domain-containing protein n=1 Tax=Streptomyces panaciradicis TaxID=1470261 RepID=UPI00201CE920|nr:HEAT repeat domain-containing protein [Streptomyces panaciradicis]MCL6667687.1 HEAT repeat domain-containing protein [Streptomyces panaciradicis]